MRKTKIVVTGGPSGGKTTFLEIIQREMGSAISIVPEAATIVYKGGFPRKTDPRVRIHSQRCIYFVQRELESLTETLSLNGFILCDRGSMDALAYWPDLGIDFFSSLGTTKDFELSRYDWVLHLDTPEIDSFDTNNPVRTETHEESLELNQKLQQAWALHPRQIIISRRSNFLEKMNLARKVVAAILEGQTIESVRKLTQPN